MSSVASLRDIRRRIRSVENTKKITRAMEMVAAAKLRRFQDLLESVRPYTEKLESLLAELLKDLPASYAHPFLGATSGSGTRPARLLVVFTSDTGLCGTYNGSVEEKTRAWLREQSDGKLSFIFVGKHGAGALQKKVGEVKGVLSDLRVSRVEEILEELGKTLKGTFENEGAGEIDALYTHMESLTRYEAVTKRVLPISAPPPLPSREVPFLIEPGLKAVLDRLIPAVFEARLRYFFYHALLTEQIARMSAMRQATKNAKDMIDELTLARNKARQASITKELIEIVGGSRALKLK